MTTGRTDELLALYRRLEGMEAELVDAKLGRDTALSDLGAKNSLWASLVAERDEARKLNEELTGRKLDWGKLNEDAYSELEQDRDRLAAEVEQWKLKCDVACGTIEKLKGDRSAIRSELAKYRVVATAAWRVWNTAGPPMAELGRDLQNLTSWLDDTRVQGSPLDAKPGQGDA